MKIYWLYLIESYDIKTHKIFFKVGITSNFKKRFKKYDTHNPGYRIIDKRIVTEYRVDFENRYISALANISTSRYKKTDWYNVPVAIQERIEKKGFKALDMWGYENNDE